MNGNIGPMFPITGSNGPLISLTFVIQQEKESERDMENDKENESEKQLQL